MNRPRKPKAPRRGRHYKETGLTVLPDIQARREGEAISVLPKNSAVVHDSILHNAQACNPTSRVYCSRRMIENATPDKKMLRIFRKAVDILKT